MIATPLSNNKLLTYPGVVVRAKMFSVAPATTVEEEVVLLKEKSSTLEVNVMSATLNEEDSRHQKAAHGTGTALLATLNNHSVVEVEVSAEEVEIVMKEEEEAEASSVQRKLLELLLLLLLLEASFAQAGRSTLLR